jgi:ATP synthase protein I
VSERQEPTAGQPDPWVDWNDEGEKQDFKTLSRAEAQALASKNPSISPWRVVVVQAGVGLMVAALLWAVTGQVGWWWSALYGASIVVLPAALMARGMTSRLSSVAPGVSAVSFMLWEFGKIGVSVVLLMLAPKLVPQLSWPALLGALVLCIKVYWVALSWRGRQKS